MNIPLSYEYLNDKEKISYSQFDAEVKIYMQKYDTDESFACEKVLEKYNQLEYKTYTIGELLKSQKRDGQKGAILTAVFRICFSTKKWTQDDILYTVFADETGYISVKFTNKEIDLILPYHIEQILTIRGIIRYNKEGIAFLSNIQDVILASSDTQIEIPVKKLVETNIGYSDVIVKVVDIKRGYDKKPHHILVEDESMMTTITTWSSVIELLESGSVYYIKNLQYTSSGGNKNEQFIYWTESICEQIDKKLYTHVSDNYFTSIKNIKADKGVYNFELTLHDYSFIEYTKLGEKQTAVKYVFVSHDDSDEATNSSTNIELVDWAGVYNSALQNCINELVILKNMKFTLYNNKPQLMNTPFTQIERK
jgi:hypothetical protein